MRMAKDDSHSSYTRAEYPLKMAVPVSEVINVRQFLEEWGNRTSESDMIKPKKTSAVQYAVKEMGVSSEIAEELNAVCGTQTLQSDEFKEPMQILDSIPDVDLEAVIAQKEEIEKRMEPKYRYALASKRKYQNEEFSSYMYQTHPLVISSSDTITTPNLILKVIIYRPLPSRNARLKPLQEFLCLGSQFLTELKDVIACYEDNVAIGEFSDNPDLPRFERAKDRFKSSFFCFENTFYNDRRLPDATELSSTIIKWAENTRRGIGPFESAAMETTTFLDLNIKLGESYVYVHQGNCEHIVIFDDIRLISPSDWPKRSAYPIQWRRYKENRAKCRGCERYHARWVVVGSLFIPEDPCYLCDTCFKSLHYDKDNHKLCDFQAYPYRDIDPY